MLGGRKFLGVLGVTMIALVGLTAPAALSADSSGNTIVEAINMGAAPIEFLALTPDGQAASQNLLDAALEANKGELVASVSPGAYSLAIRFQGGEQAVVKVVLDASLGAAVTVTITQDAAGKPACAVASAVSGGVISAGIASKGVSRTGPYSFSKVLD